MAMLKCYMDDSQEKDNVVWCVGGYVSNDAGWEQYDRLWPEMLARHDVPYLHMKEMGKPEGVYKKWQPRDQHKQEIDAFFKDATAIIHDCQLTGIWSRVRRSDLNKFNSDFGLRLEPYPLAAYGCLVAISFIFRNIAIEAIFDHCDKIKSKLIKAEKYGETDVEWRTAIKNNIMCLPLVEKCSFRNVPAIQSADYLAWEFRKDHSRITDWHSVSEKPDGLVAVSEKPDGLVERKAHFAKWAAENNILPIRKSLDALMKENRVFGITWDYEGLVEENTARRGVWS